MVTVSPPETRHTSACVPSKGPLVAGPGHEREPTAAAVVNTSMLVSVLPEQRATRLGPSAPAGRRHQCGPVPASAATLLGVADYRPSNC